MKMKSNLIIGIATTMLLFGCKKYGDYEIGENTSTVYFAYQKPVRTIIADANQALFEVGVTLGGVRSNTRDIVVGFKVDSTLLADTSIMKGKTYKILPSSYYTLSDNSKMIISKGNFEGGVTVTLNQQFLNDSGSYKYTYVLPLIITSTTSDSVLRGSVANGIARKDYTVIVVKYINKYDATYYHRGFRYSFDINGQPVDTFQYVKPEEEAQYMKNYVWNLTTAGTNVLLTDGVEYYSTQTNKNYSMRLVIDPNMNVKINNVSTSLINNIVDNGGSKYDSTNQKFYLYYQYFDAVSNKTFKMKDTMIYRNSNLKLETW